MISEAIYKRQLELQARREPFVTATVVKVEKPTSATPGSVALVPADGELEGFVGGACTEQSVRLYSLQAMASGKPLLLRIVPDPVPPAPLEPGAPGVTDERPSGGDAGSVTIRNPCLSGGAIEIFLEPTVPAPRVLVVGDSPIVDALRQLGPVVGVEIVAATDRRNPVQPAPGDLALIVAAHGSDELEPLRAGVEAGLPYLGLVASRTRGAAVLAQLRDLGADPEAVARIETPAGIDIGARSAGEIALSILARVVEVRRVAERSGAAAGPARPAAAKSTPAQAETAVDPICGMTIPIDADTPRVERDGETCYFCCEGCKRAFEQQVI